MSEAPAKLGLLFPPLPAEPMTELYAGAVALIFQADIEWLQRHPEAPYIYESGIRYKDTGQVWPSIPDILRVGYADCKGIPAWRAAELVVRLGRQARPVIEWTDDPKIGRTFHFKVEINEAGKLSLEDPCERLGMK